MRSETIANTAKQTLSKILILLVLLLLILPFWTTFQDLLTQLIMRIEVYKSLQNLIVPYELKVTGTILSIAGIPIRVGNEYIEWTKAGGGNEVIYLAWNCVGWQGGLLLIVSLFAGLRGAFSTLSRIKCVLFGLFGTLLVNIFRMSLIAIGIYYVNSLAAQIVHDYFAAFLTLIWLIFFWWFSYSFILESKKASVQEEAIKV